MTSGTDPDPDPDPTANRLYARYDEAFVSMIQSKGVESITISPDQSGFRTRTSGAEVYKGTVNGTEVFLIDARPEQQKYQNNRVRDLVQLAKAAVRLGVSIPTPVILRDGWVLKAFDGDLVTKFTKREWEGIMKKLNQEQFLWDCAKLYVLGHNDVSPVNILLQEDGSYRVIDLQAMNHPFRAGIQDIRSFGRTWMRWNLPPEAYHEMEHYAVALANYIDETNLLNPYLTEQVTQNINAISKHLPLIESNQLQATQNSLELDTDVVPPEDVVSPVLHEHEESVATILGDGRDG